MVCVLTHKNVSIPLKNTFKLYIVKYRMSDLTREDIQDLRERLDDFDRKITDLYQLVAEILGSQMQQESKTKFFKIFFDKDNM